MKHVVIAISGASGVRYGIRLTEVLAERGMRITLAVSRGGARVLEVEEGLSIDPQAPDVARLLGREGPVENVRAVALDDVAAAVCSGTHVLDAMGVIPCSMGTLGRIAMGSCANVVERTADVMLKEGRPLILVPRETPLSRIHLENLLRAHDAGAAIVPAMPSFYHRPETIEDLVDFVVTKVLDRMGVRADLPVVVATMGMAVGG